MNDKGMTLVLAAALVAACGRPFSADQIVVPDAEAFVREAQGLIAKQTSIAVGEHQHIGEAQLPAGLRIPKVALPRGAFLASVLEAQVAGDHVDLILIRHTDGSGGARVWAPNSRPHGTSTARAQTTFDEGI